MNIQDWGTLIGVIFGTVAMVISIRGEMSNRQRKREEREGYGNLLYLFTQETVLLFERMVQYSSQAARGEISLSRPFLLTGADQFQELLRIGGDGQTVRALYKVREVGAQVILQVDRTHRRMESKPVYAPQSVDSQGNPVKFMSADEVAYDQETHQVYVSIIAFVRDEYAELIKASELLLHKTEIAKGPAAVVSLRKDFEAAKAQYARLSSSATAPEGGVSSAGGITPASSAPPAPPAAPAQ